MCNLQGQARLNKINIFSVEVIVIRQQNAIAEP